MQLSVLAGTVMWKHLAWNLWEKSCKNHRRQQKIFLVTSFHHLPLSPYPFSLLTFSLPFFLPCTCFHIETVILACFTLLRGIMELSFPRTFAPRSENSIGGTFALWTFRSMELSFHGTFVPWNFHSREWKWRGTFAPQNELSVIYIAFKKAFDKVPHNRLISKLDSYGIDQALVNSPSKITPMCIGLEWTQNQWQRYTRVHQ